MVGIPLSRCMRHPGRFLVYLSNPNLLKGLVLTRGAGGVKCRAKKPGNEGQKGRFQCVFYVFKG